MSENVAQWLAEIQSLQRQVNMLQQEREQAYNSVKSWRDLYEGEAKQRQRDTATHARKLKQLETELRELQDQDKTKLADAGILEGEHHSGPDQNALTHSSIGQPSVSSQRLEAEIAAIKGTVSVEQLQDQLIATKKQCEQLKYQLKTERDEHEQTRESLTAALGDAVDLLAKERLNPAP